ncbi:MAG: AAA family ATPase [Nitrospinota bacterium]|nr:AAA family ATPase [Nitrospinota bacterium]
MNVDISAINEKAKEKSAFVDLLFREIGKTIVGRQVMLEKIVIALLCRGHVLLEGVPGLAKTLAVTTLSKAMKLDTVRLQFTPDLLPADLIGTEIYDVKSGKFSVKKGPIFTNIVLADEINRAPAKVQSALLEAMQEKQITIGGETFKLDEPFMVLATQNPIEQEGTYQLPEAQVDRFMMKLKLDYPTMNEELEIVKRMSTGFKANTNTVIGSTEIIEAREVIDEIYVDEKIYKYVVDIVFASRKPKDYGLNIGDLIEYGASPRASIYLTNAAKAHAFLRHRGYVNPDDIKAVGLDILRHRIIPTYEAEAENMTSDDIVKSIFEAVPVP